MPKPRLPYTHREVARGKTFWYYRRGHGPRVRLSGDFGSREFIASYRAAESGAVDVASRRNGDGTFGQLWALYRASPDWARLSVGTRNNRDRLIKPALERAGNQPLEAWTRKFIIASLDARASTPAVARNFLGTLRAVFQWGLSREHIEIDPTVAIKVAKIKSDGFPTWTASEMATFEAHWPIGTRQRLAYDLMLWTGLRRGDAARVGPQHVLYGSIVMDTEKTGQRVSIRILPPLAKSIAATHIGDTFILSDYGRPFAKVSFGYWFKMACREAGVPGRAHGLRKALAVKLAESGASDREIGAILGNDMAKLYARRASVRRLSDAALARLVPNA